MSQQGMHHSYAEKWLLYAIQTRKVVNPLAVVFRIKEKGYGSFIEITLGYGIR